MVTNENYLSYYNLEHYLFTTVRKRFGDAGKLDAFDLFSIVVWKANRAKSKIAHRLIRKCGSLKAAAEEFTLALAASPTPEARLVLTMKSWGFYLPMATAILTVLWPEDFTVYDIRVCNELRKFHRQDFHRLGNAKAEQVWAGYQQYREAVRGAVSQSMCLRDKDRFLWGRSSAQQLVEDIARGFPSSKRPTA